MPRPPGSRDKLRVYLGAHLGEILDSEILREVAGTSEWARRVRELCDEHGMDIVTHNDRSDLRPGQYLLASLTRRTASIRAISKETRALVLDRDGFTCQMCGAVAGEPHPNDSERKTRLHIGHILDKSMGGTDDSANLRAVCSVCNEGAGNITAERPPAEKLLAQIRRAAGTEQIKVLEWLVKKYPKQTEALIQKA